MKLVALRASMIAAAALVASGTVVGARPNGAAGRIVVAQAEVPRLEAQHFAHRKEWVEDQLLRDALKLHGIPGAIVHGRYDVVCPVKNAWDLSRAWPQADLTICPTSGHSAFEPEITDALVRAADQMARRLLDLPLEEA